MGWPGCQLPSTLREKMTRCLRPPCSRPCAKHLPPTQCPPQVSQSPCGGVLPCSSVLEIRQLRKPHIPPPQSRWERKVYDAASKYEESENEIPQSCLTLCDPMDFSLPGSSAHGIFQARVLKWAAISFSRRSSQPRDRTQVSSTAGRHGRHSEKAVATWTKTLLEILT